MINKADVIERLTTLIGKELNSNNLHEALFCEEKHQKNLRRFHFGTHTYVQYKVHLDENNNVPIYADITIPGNPNTFRVTLEQKDNLILIQSGPRINYTYLR